MLRLGLGLKQHINIWLNYYMFQQRELINKNNNIMSKESQITVIAQIMIEIKGIQDYITARTF